MHVVERVPQRGALSRYRAALTAGTALALVSAGSAHAIDTIWDATSIGLETVYNNPDNWSAGPPGAADVGVFDSITGNSATFRNLTISGGALFTGALQFNPTALQYTFTSDAAFFVLEGAGIVNNSPFAPQFTLVPNAGLVFLNSSSAGNASIVVDGGGVAFEDNSRAGTASITVNTNGQVFFVGNSRAGNATIVVNDTGLLVLQDDASADNATITVRNNGAAAFGFGADGGTARFIVEAGGILDFSFTAGPGGNGIVNAGSIEGAGGIIISDLAVFTVGGRNLSTEFSGVIAECGCLPASLNKVGTGTLILSGNNTYTGTTTVSGGVLQLGNGGVSGSVAGPIVNNSVLSLNRSDTVNFANNISGTGILNHDGPGRTILLGNNTYTGATNINAGTLQGGGINAFGNNSAVTVANNAILDSGGFNQTLGSLAGGGGVSLGAANLTVGGNNVSSNFAGVIGGTGALVKAGTGVLTLSGNNTFSGGTTIAGGTLQLGNGGTSGSVLGNIANNGILAIDRSGVFILDNVITGTGAFHQNGAGTTNIVSNNTYTGATVVNGGGLLINGSIASSSSLTVNNNTFVGGTGTLPTTVINNGGTFAPGNSIGTINVQGNLTFMAGGTYAVEISPVAADKTIVSGAAALAGTALILPEPGSYSFGTQFTIITAAGGVTGTFGNTVVGNGAALIVTLSYGANEVIATVGPASLAASLPAGASRNVRAVAAGIDNAVTAGANVNSMISLFSLPPAARVSALTQLDGEVATGMQQAGFRALDLFLGTMLNPFLHGRGETAGGGPALAFAPQASPLPRDAQAAYAASMSVKAPPAPASFGQRWSVWGAAFGGTSNTDGDAGIGSQDTRTNAYGFAAGVDHRLTPDTLVGFALAGGGTSWSLASGLGTGKSDMFQAGVYGSHRFGAAYISAAAAYTWHDASTNRNLTLAGVGQLDADFDAHSFGARLEGGYRWLTPLAGITPYGAAQVLSVRTPGYAETGLLGAAPFALSYNSRTATATRTELGLWFDRAVLVNPDAALTLRARAAWAHDFDTDREIAAAFQGLPLASFTVFGASPASDFALLSAAAELRMRNGWSFALKGDAELAARTQTLSGNGTLRYAW